MQTDQVTRPKTAAEARQIIKDHGVRIETGAMGHRIYRGVSEYWDIFVDGYTTTLWILGRTTSTPMDSRWNAENYGAMETDKAVARFLLACNEDAS